MWRNIASGRPSHYGIILPLGSEAFSHGRGVASGDAHIHNVGVLPVQGDALDGPAVATEFLGTSISSGGDGAADSAVRQAYLSDNPHFALMNQQRGYQLFDLTPRLWLTEVKVMDQVQSPGGRLSILARFAVTPENPQLQIG